MDYALPYHFHTSYCIDFMTLLIGLSQSFFIIYKYWGPHWKSLGTTGIKDGAEDKLFVVLFVPREKTRAVTVASTLASHWKIYSCRLFTNLHFANDKALSGSHSKAVPWNSIKHSVACHSQRGLWVSTLPLFPCHWYTHIQMTRPLLHSLGITSIFFFSTALFNDFITHRQGFFFPYH